VETADETRMREGFSIGLGAQEWVLGQWKESSEIPRTDQRRSGNVAQDILFLRYLHCDCLPFPCSCKMNYIHYSKANFVLAVIYNRRSEVPTGDFAYYFKLGK
jgi:hypothetical protein